MRSAKKLLLPVKGRYGNDHSELLLSASVLELRTSDRLHDEVCTYEPFQIEGMSEEIEKCCYLLTPWNTVIDNLIIA
jgi:hypothetical protein